MLLEKKKKISGIGWDLLLRLMYHAVFVIYSH